MMNCKGKIRIYGVIAALDVLTEDDCPPVVKKYLKSG